MSRKVKILISMLAAVLLMVIIPSAVAIANDNEGENTSENTSAPSAVAKAPLLERVAEILGISKEQLINAFNQAKQEKRGEGYSGNVTPQQKLERLKERLLNVKEKQLEKREKIREHLATGNVTPDMLEKFLDKAVERGQINEVEAAAIGEWWASRPEAVDRLIPPARIFPPAIGKRMIAFPKGQQG